MADTISAAFCQCGKGPWADTRSMNMHRARCSKIAKRVYPALSSLVDEYHRKRQRTSVSQDSGSNWLDLQQAILAPLADGPPAGEENESATQNNFPAAQREEAPLLGTESSNLRKTTRVNAGKLPQRFRDTQFELGDGVPQSYVDQLPAPPAPLPLPSEVRSHEQNTFKPVDSARNSFGIFRRFPLGSFPSHDAEQSLELEDLVNGGQCTSNSASNPRSTSSTAISQLPSLAQPSLSQLQSASPVESASQATLPSFSPYPNKSSFMLADYYINGAQQKSQSDWSHLLSILTHPHFDPSDLHNINWNQIDRSLTGEDDGDPIYTNVNDSESPEWHGPGWKTTPIHIDVPFPRHAANPGPKRVYVGDFHSRSLIDIMIESITDASRFSRFVTMPYEQRWQPAEDGPSTKIYGELYSSPEFLQAHIELQSSPPEPDCDLERVVVGFQWASDETLLTAYGDVKLWPVYQTYGNESKYERHRPNAHLLEHVAYLESLSPSFKDYVNKQFGAERHATQPFFTHCRREMMHAQWAILFDDRFREAYQHGIVLMCPDGKRRRFYPRIFGYVADYPERALWASIRVNGRCPCPHCTVLLADADQMGTDHDMASRFSKLRINSTQHTKLIEKARKAIYDRNSVVNAEEVERLLRDESWTPTANAFAKKLTDLGVKIFDIFRVDLLHDFELGVWKDLFLHILRLIQAYDARLLGEVDRRFRAIPTFGDTTIRRFSTNVSEAKHMAARNYEDILQCAIPVFEGLLPEPHNERLMRILFTAAHWHGLAKLRMHTDETLTLLERETQSLGRALRDFRDKTCTKFDTRELTKEAAARYRRASKTAAMKTTTSGTSTGAHIPASQGQFRRQKKYNLNTVKFHNLGYYTTSIRRFGTTDGYSTEAYELEHRTSKSRYKRTNHRNFTVQMAKIDRRQARMRKIHDRVYEIDDLSQSTPEFPHARYHIAREGGITHTLANFMLMMHDNPVYSNFQLRLQIFLLAQAVSTLRSENRFDAAVGGTEGIPLSADPLRHVIIKRDSMHEHRVLQLNFTTYNVRRGRDIIRPGSDKAAVMMLASSGDHSTTNNLSANRFRYAQVLGIYHTHVEYLGPGAKDRAPIRIDFLYVRHFERETSTQLWRASQLEELRFPPISSTGAFGFISPSDVVRAAHIIPAFAYGQRDGEDSARQSIFHDTPSWHRYKVNRFADRDMIMRFHWGFAVGHAYAASDAHIGVLQEAIVRRETSGRPDSDDDESCDQEEDANNSEDNESSESDEDTILDGEWRDENVSDIDKETSDGGSEDDDIEGTYD